MYTKIHTMKYMPSSVLIICTRRIGDTLLTTPLIHTLKKRCPDVIIDALVFEGTEEVLQGNKDLRKIICIPEKQKFKEKIKFLWKLRNCYDLAISTQRGDRPIIYAFITGRKSIAPYTDDKILGKWKKFVLNEVVDFDNNTNIVVQNLKIAEKLGLQPTYEVKIDLNQEKESSLIEKCSVNLIDKFVVIHPMPRFKYKMWHQHGWIEVTRWLIENKINVVFTSGNCNIEKEYIENICQHFSSHPLRNNIDNLSGKLSISELGLLLSKAKGYIGIDTFTTHMAAASDTKTIAIFGPSNHWQWAPWPVGCKEKQPFKEKGSQIYNNIYLLQPERPDCVPCFKEGCMQHQNSNSLCLDMFPSQKVIDAIKQFL